MTKSTRRLLLVDDYYPNLVALEATLACLGAQLVTVTSGLDAVAHAQQDRYAVILIDIRMPDVSGVDACEQIRAGTRNYDTPVLFLTAEELTADELARAKQQCPVDILRKPFHAERLRARVAGLLEEDVSSAADVDLPEVSEELDA